MQQWIDQHQTVFWAYVFPVYFVALWCFVCVLVSYIGGWTALARGFRCRSIFVGERWRFQSAAMRFGAHYGNCLTVGGSDQGLYLSPMFLFRFMQPPLLIPWHEVAVARRWQFLLVRRVRLELGRELRIPFSIHPRLADRLRLAAGDRWPER